MALSLGFRSQKKATFCMSVVCAAYQAGHYAPIVQATRRSRIPETPYLIIDINQAICLGMGSGHAKYSDG